MPDRFCRYVLRTTDVDSAGEFYRDLLGRDFWRGAIQIAELPAQAASRGAPPHWLGHIATDDPVLALLRLTDQGAVRLGPPATTDRRSGSVIVRDPFGAIVALTPADDADEASGRVAWHLHSVRDEHAAFAAYAALFGWVPVSTLELGPEQGTHVTFAWDRGLAAVGSVANLARRPHVHPQWLFFFATADLDRAVAQVRQAGGLTLPAMTNADGQRIAVCDDPQGAAFGLQEA